MHVLQSYVGYKHACRTQPGLWLWSPFPPLQQRAFFMQFQVTIMQLFVLKLLIQGSPGKFCPLMHPYANSFALKSQSDFFFFFFLEGSISMLPSSQVSCKAEEGKSFGGKHLFAACNQHSRCWLFVRFKGAEMESKAAGEMVRRMVWSQHPEQKAKRSMMESKVRWRKRLNGFTSQRKTSEQTEARGKEKVMDQVQLQAGREKKNCHLDLLHVSDENLTSNTVSLPHAPKRLLITNTLLPRNDPPALPTSCQLRVLPTLIHPASGALF